MWMKCYNLPGGACNLHDAVLLFVWGGVPLFHPLVLSNEEHDKWDVRFLGFAYTSGYRVSLLLGTCQERDLVIMRREPEFQLPESSLLTSICSRWCFIFPCWFEQNLSLLGILFLSPGAVHCDLFATSH